MCHVPLAPQVPQFMLEAGYGSKQFPERRGTVGVTQPRRVAAVSTATRVAQELGEELGRTVGYQVGGGAWAHCGVSGGRLTSSLASPVCDGVHITFRLKLPG